MARLDWLLALGALIALFAAFVALQLATLFGGHEHVLRAAGLTYAEYARQGFGQLIAAAALTLAVIAAAADDLRRRERRHRLPDTLLRLMRSVYESFWADAPDDPQPWRWERRRALLLGEARPGERVLDLGCGAGRFVAALREAGADPVGVEIAEAALERARRVAPGADFRLLEPDGSVPLEHGSVDLVWCSEVLEHVADTGHLLLEARRVLRPGGRLLVTVPFHGRVKDVAIALARFEAHFDPQGQHLRFFTRASLARTLADAGSRTVRSKPSVDCRCSASRWWLGRFGGSASRGSCAALDLRRSNAPGHEI